MKKNRTSLTISDRLILSQLRLAGRPVSAAEVLSETEISAHTFVDCIARLKVLGLLRKIDIGGGIRYELTPEKVQ
jgi:hypothetical protein